jgi:iron complex transport system substrate-binding protein
MFTLKSYKTYINLLLMIILLQPGSLPAETVTDQVGRTFNVPENPGRIIALAPSITEIMYDLGQEKRLVGVTQYSTYPPEAESLPRVGSYVRLDIEKIVALQPDLCLAIKDGNPKHIVDKLVNLGIPVYVVNPRNLKQIMDVVTRLGSLLNAEQKAKELVHELIEMAGGINTTAGEVAYPRFSWEDIIVLQPEIVLISSMAGGLPPEYLIKSWQKWSMLSAVKNGRIYVVDAELFDRPTPRLVDGLEVIAAIIHPELFIKSDKRD